jgi:Tfp pilus assembly protein PilP
VVWEAKHKRALVLDPSGRAYIVKVGDPIGKNDGEIIGIDDNVVMVREAYVDFHGEKTTKEIEMRVRQSQGG